MPWATAEMTDRAKQVNLFDYLQSCHPDKIKRTGSDEYCLVEHDSLKITPSNGKWNWGSRGFGGVDPVNFLIKVWGYSFPDAVQELLDQRQHVPPRPAGYYAHAESQKKPFSLPPKHSNSGRAVAYLKSRGIDGEVIGACIKAGILYESNGKYHNCVFVGKDSKDTPRFACVRGIGTDFKRDVTGSEKKYNFALLSTMPDCRRVQVAEAAIDALSLATIHKISGPNPDKWQQTHYLSLGGTSPLALVQFLKDHPSVDKVVLGLDADPAGRTGAEKIVAAVQAEPTLSTRQIEINYVPPPRCKDYNEYLQEKLNEGKARKAKPHTPSRGRPQQAAPVR